MSVEEECSVGFYIFLKFFEKSFFVLITKVRCACCGKFRKYWKAKKNPLASTTPT